MSNTENETEIVKYPPHWIHETTQERKNSVIYAKDMIRSKAFVKLTGAAKQMLLELYMRLRVDCLKNSRNKKESRYYAKNNGKIKLTYKEITSQFGYSTATISKAIDRLVNNGFIEIAKIGVGVKRESHEIALIKNWRQYGTPEFRAAKGKSNKPINGGFKKKITSETKAVQLQKLNPSTLQNVSITLETKAM